MRKFLGAISMVGALAAAGASLADGERVADLGALTALADRGDAGAQLDLGRRLRDGDGVRWRDFEGAARWFRLAAGGGEVEALYALGRLHYEGFLVPRDNAEMLAALDAAAGRGHAGAMLTLGVIHELGHDGPAADHREALKWYELAAARGVPELDGKISYLRQRVRAKMSETEIAEALRLAQFWTPRLSMP